jgi:hypothetical protein
MTDGVTGRAGSVRGGGLCADAADAAARTATAATNIRRHIRCMMLTLPRWESAASGGGCPRIGTRVRPASTKRTRTDEVPATGALLARRGAGRAMWRAAQFDEV